jgi:hypothetical protein
MDIEVLDYRPRKLAQCVRARIRFKSFMMMGARCV